MSYLAKLFDDPKELLTLILATIGGIFALRRWAIDQKWRRVLHANALIEKFQQKRSTIQAFQIFDVVDEEIEIDFPDKSRRTVKITNDLLIEALSTFDQKELNDEREIAIRTILGDFFDDLGTFQSHIASGLIKVQDIKPHLEYWFRELTGRGRVHDDTRLGIQVQKYLTYFGYERVVSLARGIGYPFPPVTNDTRQDRHDAERDCANFAQPRDIKARDFRLTRPR